MKSSAEGIVKTISRAVIPTFPQSFPFWRMRLIVIERRRNSEKISRAEIPTFPHVFSVLEDEIGRNRAPKE